MKIKKFGFVILTIFILILYTMPSTFASSEEIGDDPNDDILKVGILDLNSMRDWLDSNYFNKRYPDFLWLYDVHTNWFSVKAGPDCVDVEEWGINDYGDDNSSLYVEVTDITDYIDSDYFSIDILVIYEDVDNNEEIRWFGELDFENDVLTENEYTTDFNYGEVNESTITGEVSIHTSNETYEIYFDSTWMTEIDTDIIIDNMYGIVFGYCLNESLTGNVIMTYFDFFPNSYYGQEGGEDEEVNDTYESFDSIIFAVTILAFLIIIFVIVAYINKSKKRGGSKRVKRNY